jgi:putative transposase
VRADFGSESELQPHAERFVKTIRTECQEHFVIFGEQRLLKEFTGRYLTERHRQRIDSQLIRPTAPPSNDNGKLDAIGCRSHFGGLLSDYYREAA